MNPISKLDETQLAALLASRICHDLISPVGAINNALELYDDDATMQQEALELIRTSATNASARLQFARLAFGASGSAQTDVDSRQAQEVATLYMTQEKPELIWTGEPLLLPKNHAKLLLNLLLIANASLPRGGVIEVALTHAENDWSFTLTAQGKAAKLPEKFATLLSEKGRQQPIDAHSIQFYYTILLANLTDMPLKAEEGTEKITLTTKV